MPRRRITIAILLGALLIALGAAVLTYLTIQNGQETGRVPFLGNLPFIGGNGDESAPIAPAAGGIPNPGLDGSLGDPRPLRQIIADDILAPTLSADGSGILYILRENGHIQRADLEGNGAADALSLTVLGAFEAAWAPGKNRVAVFYYEDGAVKRFLAGVATGTASRFLPAEATSVSFSPDGKSIAYLLRRANDTALVIADAAGQKPAVVHTTPVPDFTLAWVSKTSILLVSRPSGLAPSLVLRFDTQTRKAEPLLFGTSGIVVQSLDASSFLYSRSSENGAAETVARYALASRASDPLGFTTIAEKCGASPNGKKLYCGVPQGTILAPSPDEWYKGAVSFLDAIVEFDLETGRQKIILAPGDQGGPFDVLSPFATPDGKYLFFQDKKDGTLWRLELPE